VERVLAVSQNREDHGAADGVTGELIFVGNLS